MATSCIKQQSVAKKQSGVAIITALLIVALATAVSTAISTRLQLDVRRTGNMIAQDQARYYIIAAEDWSRRILKKDKQDNKIDSLSEDWAIALPPLPVEGGSIQGTLTDMSACLNINALFDPKTGNVDNVMKARIEQLIRNTGVETVPSIQPVLDWIDSDLQDRLPDGAEDGYYLNLDKPYRSANRPLQSISELRLIKGFEDPKLLSSILGRLCAYEPGNPANNINVNTASKEVLKSLSSNLTDDIANAIIDRRTETPFENINDFLKFNNLKTSISNTNGLSVSSDTFLLRTQAIIGKANLVVYSIIRRDASGNTTVIARSQRTL